MPFLSQQFWVEQNYRYFSANADFEERHMGQGKACCIFKLKSLISSAQCRSLLLFPQAAEGSLRKHWLHLHHGSHQVLGGWKTTPTGFAPRATRP